MGVNGSFTNSVVILSIRIRRPKGSGFFFSGMGYNPTVTNAAVAPDLNQRIGFTPEEVKKLVDLDYDYMNKNDVAFKEWWDKALKG